MFVIVGDKYRDQVNAFGGSNSYSRVLYWLILRRKIRSLCWFWCLADCQFVLYAYQGVRQVPPYCSLVLQGQAGY